MNFTTLVRARVPVELLLARSNKIAGVAPGKAGFRNYCERIGSRRRFPQVHRWHIVAERKRERTEWNELWQLIRPANYCFRFLS